MRITIRGGNYFINKRERIVDYEFIRGENRKQGYKKLYSENDFRRFFGPASDF